MKKTFNFVSDKGLKLEMVTNLQYLIGLGVDNLFKCFTSPLMQQTVSFETQSSCLRDRQIG